MNAAALAEGLALARAAEVDSGKLLEVLAAGSGDSSMRTLKAEPMLERDFDPLFELGHMLKDVIRLEIGLPFRNNALPVPAPGRN